MIQNVSSQFIEALSRATASIIELYEFYPADETIYEPQNAIRRYSTTRFNWKGFLYEREVKNRSTIRRFIGRESNTVTVNFGTLSKNLVLFATQNRIEGMWLQIRRVSLDAINEDVVIFGGRCEKPDDQGGTILVKQEIGGGDEQIPRKKFAPRCQVGRFKNAACLGGIPLSAHSPAYIAASSCNFTWNQCESFGNTDNIQMIRFAPINGTFGYTTVEVKRFLFFFTKKKKRQVSATWSSVADFSEDAVVPEVGGLTQLEFVPIMHADTGANLRSLQAVADGEIEGVFQVRQTEKKYLPILSNYQAALGKLGSSGQPSSSLFVGAGKFSGMAWVEFELTGSDPADANDDSPSTIGIVKGRKVPLPDATGEFVNFGWTDSGPLLTRFYLTSMGRHPVSQIDDESVVEAFRDCNEPVIDDTGFEQAILPQQVTGGVDFRAFASASGFGAATVDKIALMMAQGKTITGGYGQLVQAYYRYINQTQPTQFVSNVRKVRRRYTTNFVLKEQTRLRDFIFDILLPSFNGYLSFDAKGKIRIKVDKPALGTYILSAVAAGQSAIQVEDVQGWRYQLGKQILIGSFQDHSEVKRVVDWSFSGFGATIAITASATGSVTAFSSGVTLSGGNSTTPHKATVTLGGTITGGDVIALSIDGIPIVHTTQAGDDLEATAGLLAATINGHPVLKRYIRALWNTAQGLNLVIECKAGFLTLDSPLANAHFDFEETVKIEAAFGGPGQRDILKDSFKWPLGSRQTSVNRVEGEFRSMIHDWATVPIWRDYEDHQDYTHRVNTDDVNLSAVDNAHQAARLLKIYGGKRRISDWSCEFSSVGFATLLDVGDVICVSHWSSFGTFVNIPVIVEDIEDDPHAKAKITARVYRSEIYDDRVNEMTPLFLMPLQDGTATNTSGNPPDNTGGTTGSGTSGGGGDPYPTDWTKGGGGLGTGGGGDQLLNL